LAGNALAQDTTYRAERVLASNALALDATTGRSGYWQAMSWRRMLLQGGADIGKQ